MSASSRARLTPKAVPLGDENQTVPRKMQAPQTAAPRLQGLRYKILNATGPAVALVAIGGLWELASRSGWQPDYILPAPTEIARDLWLARANYWLHTKVTLGEFALGATTGVFIGVAIGIVLALVKRIRNVLYPLLIGSQSLPILALAPLLVLWFGFGMLPKIVLVVQIVFFPIAIATVSGLTSVSDEVLLFGRSLGASRLALFQKVQVPASLPYVFSGLKVSASYAAIAAVIAEWAGAREGLGALMLRANDNLKTTTVFGTLIIITALGVGSFALVSLVERIAIPWHESQQKRR